MSASPAIAANTTKSIPVQQAAPTKPAVAPKQSSAAKGSSNTNDSNSSNASAAKQASSSSFGDAVHVDLSSAAQKLIAQTANNSTDA